ncbi:hypothetical protein [Glycomyces albidus]|uniref:ABC transporter permease n=1 Tax=Glycomyces albidus TaxID=2656774 RepID=A0A6L5GCL8_9ACTN|nr:hypothetical protein [Glycomyces albidus]MQM27263.1 hypothetical protein [Glycomyces albidus]
MDQTQRLEFAAAPAEPVDPFAGRPAVTVGYAETEPAPKDRVGFQFIWEAILLLLTLNALFLVYQRRDEIFSGGLSVDALGPDFTVLASLLLMVTGFGLTLRLGAVNLAVPAMPMPVIAASTLFVGPDPLVGLAFTAGLAAAVAIVFTVLTVVFRIPPWLAGLASLVVLAGSLPALRELDGAVGGGAAGTWADPGGLWLFLGAAALSVAGGLLGLLPGVRDRFSKVKGAADGTGDREAGSVVALLGGNFLALLLAAGGGFLAVVFRQGEDLLGLPGAFAVGADAGVVLTAYVFIVVFLAGTSPWGRRGGAFGTVLALIAVWALGLFWQTLEGPASDPDRYRDWTGAVYAGLLLLGLFVSFGLDRLGRPKEPTEPDESTAEMTAYDTADPGTGLFEPTLPDAAAANR